MLKQYIQYEKCYVIKDNFPSVWFFFFFFGRESELKITVPYTKLGKERSALKKNDEIHIHTCIHVNIFAIMDYQTVTTDKSID